MFISVCFSMSWQKNSIQTSSIFLYPVQTYIGLISASSGWHIKISVLPGQWQCQEWRALGCAFVPHSSLLQHIFQSELRLCLLNKCSSNKPPSCPADRSAPNPFLTGSLELALVSGKGLESLSDFFFINLSSRMKTKINGIIYLERVKITLSD